MTYVIENFIKILIQFYFLYKYFSMNLTVMKLKIKSISILLGKVSLLETTSIFKPTYLIDLSFLAGTSFSLSYLRITTICLVYSQLYSIFFTSISNIT